MMDNNDSYYFFNLDKVLTRNSCLKLYCHYRIALNEENSIKVITAKLINVLVLSDLVTLTLQTENQNSSITISMNVFSNEKNNWVIYDLE